MHNVLFVLKTDCKSFIHEEIINLSGKILAVKYEDVNYINCS